MVRFMLLRNMDDLIDLEQVGKAGGRRACKEIFRDRNNHLIDMYDNVDFRQRFRQTRGTVSNLLLT